MVVGEDHWREREYNLVIIIDPFYGDDDDDLPEHKNSFNSTIPLKPWIHFKYIFICVLLIIF